MTHTLSNRTKTSTSTREATTNQEATGEKNRDSLLFAIVAAIAVVVAGGIVGAVLVSRHDPQLLPRPGTLVEVRTGDGSWLVGVLVSGDASYLRISSPGDVQPVAAPSGGGSQYQVVLLSQDPYRVDGDIQIAREQVSMIGAVASGSGLESAYASVLRRTLGSPAATPSGSP